MTIPPWVEGARVHFRLDIGATILRDMPDTVRRRAPRPSWRPDQLTRSGSGATAPRREEYRREGAAR